MSGCIGDDEIKATAAHVLDEVGVYLEEWSEDYIDAQRRVFEALGAILQVPDRDEYVPTGDALEDMV